MYYNIIKEVSFFKNDSLLSSKQNFKIYTVELHVIFSATQFETNFLSSAQMVFILSSGVAKLD